jgi:hypothetical protein
VTASPAPHARPPAPNERDFRSTSCRHMLKWMDFEPRMKHSAAKPQIRSRSLLIRVYPRPSAVKNCKKQKFSSFVARIKRHDAFEGFVGTGFQCAEISVPLALISVPSPLLISVFHPW